jgi:N-acetylglucosaminyl-diphospho-decaprenol L-rhamnosyltransferase
MSLNQNALSVIIVSWNTRQLLKNCLDSIFANPPTSPFEIWVVDNASTDGTPKMVQERYSQVHFIENHENVGFARANNQAIKQCTGKYILLLNPDTFVDSCSLEIMVDFLEGNSMAGAAGARLFNPDGTMQISSHPWPTLSRELLRLFHLDRILPYTEYPQNKWIKGSAQEVDVLMGACLILRKDILDQIGYLDEDYFIYSEEVDLCYRIQRAGWSLYWIPQAKVVHFGGQSTQQVPTQMFLNLYHSKIKYFRKHYGTLAAKIYILILMFASLSRIVMVPIIFFEKAVYRRRHLTLVNRYWRLIITLFGM